MDPAAAQLPNIPSESNDIFSLSDQTLSDRLEFIEEIGFGNWGSVWLCRPKPATTQDGVVRPLGQKLAVKLVHRSKTSTTAARVRSLWNEMKIVRSFKADPHPSIIPFHSFIITPSYALITMSYLPILVPVEVEESKAREWFRFLLSGIEFLHKRGVVHNDIKPANILLSHKNIPVLVDFGFAEKYDMASDTAFHSNLSYGTPEYLSPERARGLPHDTRKSDVWALGVTFFEILIGRTPFEHSDGEQFNSNEDLEKYWARTLRGKWVGTWQFSKGMEKLLQRMIAPNADLRCTAMQAIADSYWQAPKKDSLVLHKRASSCTSSIVFEKDIEKLLNMTPSWKSKENNTDAQSPPPSALELSDIFKDEDPFRLPTLAKAKSQPRVASKIQPRKRVPIPPIVDLSPIKASPTSPPFSSTAAKENISSFNRLACVVAHDDAAKKKQQHHHQRGGNRGYGNADTSVTSNANANARRPFGALNARDNLPRPSSMIVKKPSGHSQGAKAVKVLGEFKNITIHGLETQEKEKEKEKAKESTNVKDRVREWEREKERLREMERLEEMERERDEIYTKERERRNRKERAKAKERSKEEEKKNPSKEEEEEKEETGEKERKNASHLQIRIPKPTHAKGNGKTSKDWDWDKENIGSSATSPVLPMFRVGPPLTQVLNGLTDTPPPPSSLTRVPKEMNKGSLKHSIKASIDKTMQFCKSSTIAQVASGRSTPARGFSFDVMRPNNASTTKNGNEAWEPEVEAEESMPVSPLPVIKNAAESERVAADSRMDRMQIWMRNVDKVVEDAKQNFASSASTKDLPLPPLPPPLSRNASQNRTSRLPRRVLAASQIFQADENGNISPMGDQTMMSMTSAFLTANDISRGSIGPASPTTAITPCSALAAPPKTPEVVTSPLPGEGRCSLQIPEIHTPSRLRRATVSTRSPEPADSASVPGEMVVEDASPSKRKEKSRSYGNLFQMHIAPISFLEAELSKIPPPEPTPRLSQVLDRNLFIAPLLTSRDDLLDSQSIVDVREPSLDDLNSSPCHVEPYPQRARRSPDAPIPDTPSRHRIEGVYDRFLMATSGVKRLGKGYQSDNVGPVCSSTLGPAASQQQQHYHKGRPFYSTRRPMPAPVSSEDSQRRAASVDELGNMTMAELAAASGGEKHSDAPGANLKEEGNLNNSTTVGLMRKAIKLMVPKATNSRRLSRIG